jgi:hypothetical protein
MSDAESQALTQEFESAVGTAIVKTIAAALPAEPDSTQEPLPTATHEIADGEQSSEAANTQVVIVAESATPSGIQFTPTATDLPTPCYLAELVDETIPDGTKMGPGQGFIKIWNIRNAGVCEWTEDFHWVLTDGEDFRGPVDLRFGKTVMPGEVLKVALELSTPNVPGSYEGIYKIINEEDALVTPNGFWIRIVVEEEGS